LNSSGFTRKALNGSNSGDSCIIAPNGKIITGPAREQKEILYAEVDLKQIIAAKRMLDVARHYARPDVFDFNVNRRPDPVMRLKGAE